MAVDHGVRTVYELAIAVACVADRTGFVSIAYDYGAAWLTNYDRGTLMELTPP